MATPLKWLHSFEAVARLGNMTLAAEEIGLTQAALSQQMRALESHLKLQLFIREPRGMSLTAAGAQFLSDVSPGLEQIGNALRRYRQPQGTRLRILCNTSFSLRWLLPRLPDFHARHPDIQAEIRNALWRPDRHGYDPDIEIFLGGAHVAAPAVALARCELIAVHAPKANPEGPVPFVRITGLDSLFEEWLQTPALRERGSYEVIAVDSVHAAVTLAGAGVGWTLCPSLLVGQELQEKTLRAASSGLKSPARAYWLQMRPAPNTAAEAFGNWIRETARLGEHPDPE